MDILCNNIIQRDESSWFANICKIAFSSCLTRHHYFISISSICRTIQKKNYQTFFLNLAYPINQSCMHLLHQFQKTYRNSKNLSRLFNHCMPSQIIRKSFIYKSNRVLQNNFIFLYSYLSQFYVLFIFFFVFKCIGSEN